MRYLTILLMCLCLTGCQEKDNQFEQFDMLKQTARELRKEVFKVGHALGSNGISIDDALKVFDTIEDGGTPDEALSKLIKKERK